MPSYTWSKWSGMQPVSPASGERNPVTLIENFLIRADGVLERRSGFASAAFTAVPRNHIVVSLVEASIPYMVLKTDSGWWYKGSSAAPIALVVTDLPIELRAPAAGDRGSFGAFGGEVYYCDEQSIWRWNGLTTNVSPVGMPYYDLGDPSPDFNYCATLDPSEEDKWWLNDCTFDPNCDQTDPDCNLRSGSKSGSFAVSYSWYDPVRHIYGRRSKPQTAVIAAYSGGPVKLFGWRIVIPEPAVDYSSQYDIVVWASQSVSIKLLQGTFNQSTGQIEYVLSHQVGDELSDLHFFEGFATAIGEEFVMRKDNATLAKDGPALDVYEPPHPSDFMLILTDGTTLYFNPSILPTPGDSKRYAIEYSVGHPEQVGRDSSNPNLARRAANGPTLTYAANQKGRPISAISSTGGEAVLLTDQEVYVVRFRDGVVDLVPQGQNRGVRSQASITESSFGLSYLADEGHVLISGRETVLLDAEIGYSTYLEWIETTTRSVMAGGSAEDYIFLWMPDFDPLASARGDSYDPSVHRAALVYNHADKVLLRFRLGSASHVQYAAGGRLDDGSRIFCYTGEKELYWPSTADKDDGETFHSKVVVWLNDQPSATKTIRSLTVEYGDVDQGLSGPEVSVRAMEHWNDPNRNAVLVVAGSTNHRGIDVRNRRENYQEFMGMQGRYFEITVRTNSGTDGSTWDSGLFDVVAITVEYDSDVEEGHHGAPGENS